MVYTTKGRSAAAAHEDAHGRMITHRHVKGKGTASPRGGPVVTDANNDDLSSTMVCDADATTPVAAAGSVYIAGAVWLARAVVLVAGTVKVDFWDNAGPTPTATGTQLGTIPANATAGSQWNIQMPANAGGVSVVGAAGSHQIVVATH